MTEGRAIHLAPWWPLKVDLAVLEVLRDQSYYRAHARAGGAEVDPMKKGQ